MRRQAYQILSQRTMALPTHPRHSLGFLRHLPGTYQEHTRACKTLPTRNLNYKPTRNLPGTLKYSEGGAVKLGHNLQKEKGTGY